MRGGGIDSVRTVLWLPRWSAPLTTFFTYKDTIIKYFLQHKNLKLICRPHPLMLKNFLANGLMSQQEIDSFLKLFAEQENFEFDYNPDYFPALMKSDIFLSDISSLLVEELVTGKPVIYLGTANNFSEEFKSMAELFYSVNNSRELIETLDAISGGHDDKRQERLEYISEHMNFDRRAGERITAFLKQEFYGQ